MPSNSNRRDFLKGKSALQAFGDLILAALPPGAAGDTTARGRSAGRAAEPLEHYLLHVGRRAMACEFQVFFNVGQYPQATEVALEVLDLVEKIEAQLSFFRDTSDISQINRHAAQRPVEVEPGLFSILDLALRLHAETGGAFDITSGPLWEVWGFARRAGSMPDPELLAEARTRVGSSFSGSVRCDS